MSRREFLNKTVMPVGTVLFLAFLFRPLCMVQGALDWRWFPVEWESAELSGWQLST